MPNHISTVCTVTGAPAIVAAFSAAHLLEKTDERSGKPFVHFDFETIVPCPAIVKDTESGSQADDGFYVTSTHEDYARWLEKTRPETLEKGRKSLQCFRETGFRDWYEWNIRHWGTKWNSYQGEVRSHDPGRLVFKFETAWSFPEPIFKKLAELHPELRLDVVTIDEGGGEYEGHFAGADQRFERVTDSAERYRLVYGREPYSDDEDSEEAVN